MHLLLTDRLSCPRCGPSFGLILLAHRLDDRRVREGVLGCPNCRDGFPIREGFADLRAPPRIGMPAGLVGGPPGADAATSDDDAGTSARAGRLLALLGIAGGPGTVALVGGPARLGAELAAAAAELQVVGIDADLVRWRDGPRFSRVVAGPGLPFFTGALRGVAADARLAEGWLGEALRVLAPRGRLVVANASDGVAERLGEAGAEVLAVEAGTVVATRG